MIYLIGSLRNPAIPIVARELRAQGFEVFDDWYSPGATTDEEWQRYEQTRGRTYKKALKGSHARHVFEFDVFNLNLAQGVVLVLPAGKSAHLELGYASGQEKPCFILTDGEGEPDRFDVMTQFAVGGLYHSFPDLVTELKKWPWLPSLLPSPLHMTDVLWLAGLLEGDGTFVCDSLNGKPRKPRPRVQLMMTDRDIVERAANLFPAPMNGPYIRPARKPVWVCATTGRKAAEWMRILRPYMGIRRRARIDEILGKWNPYSYRKWRRK